MKFSNIQLGDNVEIDPSTTFNNVVISDYVKIAKRCSIFGGPDHLLEIGSHTYVGMNTLINGFAAQVKIGSNVSIAQNVNIMADSGPNASAKMQRLFPLEKGEIHIGDHCWIGASAVIMPSVTLGDYCIVAANSYVNGSFPKYSIIGGSPAKLIRSFTSEEINKLEANDDKIS
jgi:acetyltransferase-like isoleucine patch superfamily enzyme